MSEASNGEKGIEINKDQEEFNKRFNLAVVRSRVYSWEGEELKAKEVDLVKKDVDVLTKGFFSDDIEQTSVALSRFIYMVNSKREGLGAKMTDYCIQKVMENDIAVLELMGSEDEEIRFNAISLLSVTFQKKIEKGSQSELVVLFKNNRDRFYKIIEDKETLPAFQAYGILKEILPYCELEVENEIKNRIANSLLNSDSDYRKRLVVADLLDPMGWGLVINFGEELLEKVIGSKIKSEDGEPVPMNVWLDSWRQSAPADQLKAKISGNLETMMSIEEKRPGAVDVLRREFGVLDLSRYPVELLIAQFDHMDDVNKPYMIILFPRDDHNGVFYTSILELGRLYEGLKNNLLIRVIEGGTKWEIGKRMLRLNQLYGEKQKIAGAIIGGHGTKDTINFGGEVATKRLTLDELGLGVEPRGVVGRGIQKIGRFFVEKPMILLNSCETGQEGGIAEKMSQLGARVVAPSEATRIVDIEGEFDGVNLTLRPRYYKGLKMEFVGGVRVD